MKSVLEEDVEKVILSNRLDSSPCVLVTSEFGWTANMQRIMKAQALGSGRDMGYMMSKKTLEINPHNNIIKRIKERLDTENSSDSKHLRDLVFLLHDVTLQSSGFVLDDPSKFSNRILKLINIGLGVEEEIENNETVLENNNDNEKDNSTMEEVD